MACLIKFIPFATVTTGLTNGDWRSALRITPGVLYYFGGYGKHVLLLALSLVESSLCFGP